MADGTVLCALMQAVYVPADDLTDPAPATTFAHLDATTVLSRSIAELGIYPAVDPLDSTSRMLNPIVIGPEHYGVARGVQKVLQDYKNLQVRRAGGANHRPGTCPHPARNASTQTSACDAYAACPASGGIRCLRLHEQAAM